MYKTVLVLMIGVVAAACSAGSPREANTATTSTATNAEAGWEGDACTVNVQCNTLWCVNGRCERPEP